MEQRAYVVVWKVEVDSTSPEAAAEAARFVMSDGTRNVDIFEVEEIDDHGLTLDPVVITVTDGVGKAAFPR